METSEPRRENVYLQLREEILSCALAPGQNLHESELAGRFSVSKSPVRDALMRLEAERLVIVQARRGYQVAPVSIADAADLFEFRKLMEEAAVQKAASSADSASLASLDRFRSLAAWGGQGGFVAYNREFHVALARLCPNRRIQAAAQDLIEHFDRLVVMSVSVSERVDTELLIGEHGAIIDAVQARDARKAKRLVSDHIERARRRVMNSLARTPIVP